MIVTLQKIVRSRVCQKPYLALAEKIIVKMGPMPLIDEAQGEGTFLRGPGDVKYPANMTEMAKKVVLSILGDINMDLVNFGGF